MIPQAPSTPLAHIVILNIYLAFKVQVSIIWLNSEYWLSSLLIKNNLQIRVDNGIIIIIINFLYYSLLFLLLLFIDKVLFWKSSLKLFFIEPRSCLCLNLTELSASLSSDYQLSFLYFGINIHYTWSVAFMKSFFMQNIWSNMY